ncbi:MAG TPA: hypothetical protein VLL05_12520, partial [Terriglobales bacterium]|nr:hypothetical protein [Terriglobales bacterium]
MQTETEKTTEPGVNPAVEQKIQKLREVFSDAPQMAKTALENKVRDLASHLSEPRSRMESAGRAGSRQGTVSELTLLLTFAPGGARRLRTLLQTHNGNFDDADKVGTVHDMRFVFLDNDARLLFATAYDGEWDAYIDAFVTKIPTSMDLVFDDPVFHLRAVNPRPAFESREEDVHIVGNLRREVVDIGVPVTVEGSGEEKLRVIEKHEAHV